MLGSLTSLGNKLNKSLPNISKISRNIDRSAQRNYLEQGYLSNNFDDISAKLGQILIQQPEATIIFRKKMYTSLSNNYYSLSSLD